MGVPRVLICEPEGIAALDLQTCLHFAGYAGPIVASTRREALKEAEAKQPDVIITEVTLDAPLNGIETAREISFRYGIPIIFLTSHSDVGTVERAQSANPYAYLLKPSSVRQLAITLEMALQSRNANESAPTLIPICSACKRIRNSDGSWEEIEGYLRKEFGANLTHTLCPTCVPQFRAASNTICASDEKAQGGTDE